jgi:hypothetical protein
MSGEMSKVVQIVRTGPNGSDEGSRDDVKPLLDDLALRLADAAHQGILLTSGPLSRRKTDWVLSQLSEQLGQAAELVERLRRQA